jgi:catechol 2,3-dioxygenase-like lactoylglutathione lyase family enzyme
MVHDMDKSIAFYTSVLGFKVLKQYGNFYAQVAAPGIIIGLHPSDKKANTSENISIGFTADNFEEVKSSLGRYGINYQERKEEGGNFMHLTDPDGTPLYFIEPKKWG